MKKLLLTAAILLFVGVASLSGQGALSNQVLQLLTRVNAWTTTNTFTDLRVVNAAIPSVTTYRIYADTSGNLYFNGGLIAGAGGGVTPHNLLSTTHSDTLAGSPARGSVIVGNSTPAWAALTIGASGSMLRSNGTDVVFSTDASGLTSIPAANITGTLPAISGVNLTALNATQLTSGTVPLARLVNITNTEISASAAIVRSKLSLAAGIVLTTDVTGILPFANGGTNLSTAADDTTLISSGSAWVAKAIPNCVSGTTALAYTTATNTLSCQTISVGTGTVTSVAATVPTGFTISGSPVTTSGTLGIGLSTQTANTVWAGPTGGGAVAPAFRALVSADFPTSGAVAGTYPLVTVNNKGIVTAGSASLASGTITTSQPWTFTQTWNAGAVTFNALLVNVTNTASAAASTLMDLQLGGVSQWAITRAGAVTQTGTLKTSSGIAALGGTPSSSVGLVVSLSAANQILTSTQGASEISGVNAIDLAATWNNAANTPTFFKINVTDTASNAASLLADWQKGGVSQFKVTKSGALTITGGITATTGTYSGSVALNAGGTVATGQTLAVTDQDKLTVGGNIIPNTRVITCYGLNSNTLSGDCIWIADRNYQVTGIKIMQTVQGAGGCVIDVEKMTGTTAPGAGTVLGTASYDCQTTTNNTVTTYALTGTVGTLQFTAGDRMGIKMGGTLTNLRGGTVGIFVKAI